MTDQATPDEPLELDPAAVIPDFDDDVPFDDDAEPADAGVTHEQPNDIAYEDDGTDDGEDG